MDTTDRVSKRKLALKTQFLFFGAIAILRIWLGKGNHVKKIQHPLHICTI